MDVNTQLIDDLKKDIVINNDKFEDINGDLKKILKKIRKPGKLCIDLFLLLILAFLAACLVWSIKYYIKMT